MKKEALTLPVSAGKDEQTAQQNAAWSNSAQVVQGSSARVVQGNSAQVVQGNSARVVHQTVV